MNMNLVDSVLNTPRKGEEKTAAATTAVANDDDMMDAEESSLQVRTMEVPRWLSTSDVTSKLIIQFHTYDERVDVCWAG